MQEHQPSPMGSAPHPGSPSTAWISPWSHTPMAQNSTPRAPSTPSTLNGGRMRPSWLPPPPRDMARGSTAWHNHEWPGRGMGRLGVNLQMEILLPDWVEIAVDSFSPFFCLSNLDSDIGVTGTRLILCLQALGTNHCSTAQHSRENRQREKSVPQPHQDPQNRHLCPPRD